MTTEGRQRRIATPWGRAALLERVEVAQEADARSFGVVVELLAGDEGARFVRLAYTTDGTARRGPVTLRVDDVERLWSAVRERPELARALQLGRASQRKEGR